VDYEGKKRFQVIIDMERIRIDPTDSGINLVVEADGDHPSVTGQATGPTRSRRINCGSGCAGDGLNIVSKARWANNSPLGAAGRPEATSVSLTRRLPSCQ